MRIMMASLLHLGLSYYGLLHFSVYILFLANIVIASKPNVIIILADDLGYGDLQVSPFRSHAMRAISTPNLLKMAQSGVIMDNFHTAAPICSPTRASIMTSLFPWRLGVDFIYAGDKKNDGSVEIYDDHLPMIPNIAMNFKEAGYATSHVGKWHLGGMHNQDIDRRNSPKAAKGSSTTNSDSNTCSVPGINQYGFTDYVSVAEGTGSDSQIAHMKGNLYHTGSQMMVRNDHYMSRIGPGKTTSGSTNDYNKLVDAVARNGSFVRTLTEAETDHAMDFISLQAGKKAPFFLNLWYHAPHSPWEVHEPYYSRYVQSNTFDTDRMKKYASMISHMDENIGRLLHLLDKLGIADNTLVVFTSDNGPEIGAGSAGIFKGHKRLLSEGGIRVPCIWQWKGKIQSNSITSKFGITTDIWPTVAEAAGLKLPTHIRIDGTSLLPALMQSKHSTLNPARSTGGSNGNEESNVMQYAKVNKDMPVEGVMGDERLVLWYATAPGYPRFSAAWSHGIKFVWNDYEGRKRGKNSKLPATFRAFDMYKDPTEQFDLIQSLKDICSKGGSAGGGKDNYVLFKYFSASSRPLSSHPPYLKAMVEYLQLHAHLFRHIAPHDWFHYLQNRLTVTQIGTLDTSRLPCGIYSSAVPSLSWSTDGLQPQFCGEKVYKADQSRERHTCLCSLNSCSVRWNKGNHSKQPMSGGGWTTGTIPQGLAPFMTHNPQYSASEGGKEYSQDVYYGQILHVSRYTAACTAPMKASTPVVSLILGDKQIENSMDGAMGIRDEKVRSRHVLKGESACHHEQPVSILNTQGVAQPLYLCAQSLYSFKNESFIDIHLYHYVLNDAMFKDSQDMAWLSYLLTGHTHQRKTAEERIKEQSKCPVIVMIDPHCVDSVYKLSSICHEELVLRITGASPYYGSSKMLVAPVYSHKGDDFKAIVLTQTNDKASSYILSIRGQRSGDGDEHGGLLALHAQLAQLMGTWPKSTGGTSTISVYNRPKSVVLDAMRSNNTSGIASGSGVSNMRGGISMWWALYSLKTALCRSPLEDATSSALQVPHNVDLEAFIGGVVQVYEKQSKGQKAEIFKRIAATTYSPNNGGGGGKKGGRGTKKGG